MLARSALANLTVNSVGIVARAQGLEVTELNHPECPAPDCLLFQVRRPKEDVSEQLQEEFIAELKRWQESETGLHGKTFTVIILPSHFDEFGDAAVIHNVIPAVQIS